MTAAPPPPTLDKILPEVLQKLEDMDSHVVQEGLQRLLQSFQTHGREEFLDRNWASVLHHALLKLTNEKDPTLISSLGAAFLKTLDLLAEEDPREMPETLSKFDTTLSKILFVMEIGSLENGGKRAWLSVLQAFLQRMGLSSMHWVDRINALLIEYVTSTTDMELWVQALKCVQALVKNTWVKPSSREWLQIILKILFNKGLLRKLQLGGEAGRKQEVEAEIYENIDKCMELICSCEDFHDCKADLEESVKLMDDEVAKNENRKNKVLEYNKEFLDEVERSKILQYCE